MRVNLPQLKALLHLSRNSFLTPETIKHHGVKRDTLEALVKKGYVLRNYDGTTYRISEETYSTLKSLIMQLETSHYDVDRLAKSIYSKWFKKSGSSNITTY